MEEEIGRSSFNSVVKETTRDLKSKGHGYCFFTEQVKAVKELINFDVSVIEKEGIYYLTKVKKNDKLNKNKKEV